MVEGSPAGWGFFWLVRTVCGPNQRVAISGEIDYDCAACVEDTLMASLAEPGAGDVCVDLAGLRFMDAKCAQALLAVRHRADLQGVAMRVTCATGIPRQVLEILGLYDYLRTSGGTLRRQSCPFVSPKVR